MNPGGGAMEVDAVGQEELSDLERSGPGTGSNLNTAAYTSLQQPGGGKPARGDGVVVQRSLGEGEGQ